MLPPELLTVASKHVHRSASSREPIARSAGLLYACRGLGLVLLLISGVLSASSSLPGSADATELNQDDSAQRTIQFNIPSQALEDAIYAFGAATTIAVFVDGSAVSGLRSTEVKGIFPAAEALGILLTGTGLDMRPVGERAITLVPQPRQARSSNMEYRRYSAGLQDAALRQLCYDDVTHLGTFRIAMQMWIDERGQAARVELLSSTGDAARDDRLRELMIRISGGVPPPKLPQPIVMVILPRAPDATGDCRAGRPPPRDEGGWAGRR